jgi:ribulose-5-phosphate 4-epimerase/fuculose-1-phosphate aldolase
MAMTDRPPPSLPTFSSVDEERLHRRQRLAVGLRLFGRLGFDEGVAGHITARDPELADHFWVNPFAMSFKRIRVRDLLLIDAEGKVVQGTWPVNTAAFCIHSQIHAARPDVVAAAHAHGTYGKAWSALHRPLQPLTQDACAFFEDHEVYEDYAGVVYDLDEGARIAKCLGEKKAVILTNHGMVTVGTSVDEAVWWFVTLERSCQVQLAVEAAGGGRPIPDDVARLTRGQVGSHVAGWLSFQSLYDWIVATEPDVLDD